MCTLPAWAESPPIRIITNAHGWAGGTSKVHRNAVAALDAAPSATTTRTTFSRDRHAEWHGSLLDSTSSASGRAVTVALIGGSLLLREATASLLSSQDGLRVVGTFESATHFLAASTVRSPAVLLFDSDRYGTDALQAAVAALSSPSVGSRVVLLCREFREDVVRCALEHSVSGVLLKSYPIEDVRSAIAYIVTGRTLMPAGWQRAVSPRPRLALSPRHRQILALIAEGRCNEEIAAELQVSPNTVKFHVRAVYARLGVRNRVEAANRYAQMTSSGA
jgi:DNA-binding NarL/FixJ family response regulator